MNNISSINFPSVFTHKEAEVLLPFCAVVPESKSSPQFSLEVPETRVKDIVQNVKE